MVEAMKPGSIVVDMAAEAGGNCAVTQPGKLFVHNGVKIIGERSLPPTEQVLLSLLYDRLHRPSITATDSIVNSVLKQHHKVPPLYWYRWEVQHQHGG